MKTCAKFFRILVLVCFILLACAGFGLPIPYYPPDDPRHKIELMLQEEEE